MPVDVLRLLLLVTAVVQIVVSVINLALPRLLGWRDCLAALPLLVREVFHVHLFYISVTCAIFGVLTWRFADELAAGTSDVARWLAAAIALFWGSRTVIQVVYYSKSHWRGHAGRTAVHCGCLVGYGGLTTTYALAVAA